MQKIKLGLVSPYPPSKGTLNEYAFHLVKHLRHKVDIEKIVIFSDDIGEGYDTPELNDGCPVTIRSSWKFNKLTNFISLVREIKKAEVDLVLFNLQFLSFGDKKLSAAIGLLTPMITRLFGVPSVVLLHNITETVDLDSAGITSNPILRWIYSLSGTILTKILLWSNLVTFTIPKYVEIIEKKYRANNIALVPHGSFEVPPMPDFDKGNEELNVMTFGKFGTYKKVENMIDAVVRVREKTNRRIKIVIAGTDNPNVPGYLDSVKEKYKDVSDIVFTGYVEEEDVPRLFNASSFVVFDYASTTGSSGVLHQSGSYGKAVVIPKIGDLQELIEEEGYIGAYYEPGNVDEMTEAIHKLVIDPDYRKNIATNNYLAAASLPLGDIADWYILHFQSLIKTDTVKERQRETTLALDLSPVK